MYFGLTGPKDLRSGKNPLKFFNIDIEIGSIFFFSVCDVVVVYPDFIHKNNKCPKFVIF